MSAEKANRTLQKYEDIRFEYAKWTAKKYKNVRTYTDAYIFIKLAEKYYLSERTVENIVFHRVLVKS